MKKIKVSLFAMMAIALGIAFSSFTASPKTTSQKWFLYDGVGSASSAASYNVAPGDGADPLCAADPVMVCAIYATDNNGHPDATELSDIVRDSNTFQAQLEGLVEYKEE